MLDIFFQTKQKPKTKFKKVYAILADSFKMQAVYSKLINSKPNGMVRGHFYKTNYNLKCVKYKVSEMCVNNP